MELSEIKEKIKTQANEVGFDTIGFTSAVLPSETYDRLARFVEDGHHGSMGWMEGRQKERSSPHHLWEEAKSVIMLGLNYGPDEDPLPKLDNKLSANISVYAQNKDYHDLIKKRLKRIGRWMCENFDCSIKVFVDTAPVMEKPLAMQSGLGWQGKHTNLVSKEYGSWLFLGAIYTTLELEPDEETQLHCGTCSSCLDICPTKAFPAPFKLDARRCISYLTIEHKGSIPEEFREAMGNRIYGCDDCLAICPWNKFASQTKEEAFHPRDYLKAPLLQELALLDDTQFREYFRASPVKRIGRDRFVRNVAIALGNSNAPEVIPTLEVLSNDHCETVRETSRWAIQKLQKKNSKTPAEPKRGGREGPAS